MDWHGFVVVTVIFCASFSSSFSINHRNNVLFQKKFDQQRTKRNSQNGPTTLNIKIPANLNGIDLSQFVSGVSKGLSTVFDIMNTSLSIEISAEDTENQNRKMVVPLSYSSEDNYDSYDRPPPRRGEYHPRGRGGPGRHRGPPHGDHRGPPPPYYGHHPPPPPPHHGPPPYGHYPPPPPPHHGRYPPPHGGRHPPPPWHHPPPPPPPPDRSGYDDYENYETSQDNDQKHSTDHSNDHEFNDGRLFLSNHGKRENSTQEYLVYENNEEENNVNSETKGDNDNAEASIFGYLDDNFPVILLNQNEIR